MVRAEQPGEEAIWARLSVRRELGRTGITGHDEGPGVCGVCNEKPRQGFRREICMVKSGPFLVLGVTSFCVVGKPLAAPLPLEAHTLM